MVVDRLDENLLARVIARVEPTAREDDGSVNDVTPSRSEGWHSLEQ
jgi:hypothetical protein